MKKILILQNMVIMKIISKKKNLKNLKAKKIIKKKIKMEEMMI